jgi:hypothetical protein
MSEIDSLEPAQPDRVEENHSGGVDLQAERDVVIGGDVVGRDKIVQYIDERVPRVDVV